MLTEFACAKRLAETEGVEAGAYTLLFACCFALLQVAELQQMPPLHEQLLDGFLAAAHHTMTAVEPLRVLAGAGANTRDSPACITDYQPSDSDLGGFFDDASRAKRAYAAKQQSKPQQQPQVVQLQVQQLQEPLQQQGGGLGGVGGSATSLAAAVAAAEQEVRLQQESAAAEAAAAAAAAEGSNTKRRWRLRRQRDT